MNDSPPAVEAVRRGNGIAARVSMAITLVAAVVLACGLYRVQSQAAAIRSEADRMAESVRTVRSHSEAIAKLAETNRLATSILRSTEPISERFQQLAWQSNDLAEAMRSIRGNAAR